MAETNGSLTSDFRSKASPKDRAERAEAKRKRNFRNKQNQAALGEWNHNLANSLNKTEMPRPTRLGGYKKA